MTAHPIDMDGEEEFFSDNYFMAEALKQAQKAYAAKEVPVGAVIVLNKKIISRGHNQVEMLKDATAHAEMIALTGAAGYIGDWRLNEAILYVTLEPCVMCTGAIVLSRIKKIVFGAHDPRFGGIESFSQIVKNQKISPEIEIQSGLFKEESVALLQKFFKEKRIK